MRRRIEIVIDSVTVDASLAGNRRAIAAAIERAVAAHLRAPGALDGLAPRQTAHVDGGRVPRGGGLDAIGSAVAAAAIGGERR